MPFYSPLRYPGGKNKLANFIAKVCINNNINGHYVEPYVGGASVALYLLINDFFSKITINDIDLSIYAFWYSVINDTKNLCTLILDTDVNIDSWKRCKYIQKNKNNVDLLELGFSTFFLNRTNFSGILNGGVIGGKNQNGKYKIDCRFNKEELISRIKLIANYREQIDLYNLNATQLIKIIQFKSENTNTIYYIDPPYYLKGKSLYVDYYNTEDHTEIGKMIKEINNSKWIVSYDNVTEIKKLYNNFNKIEYSFFHTAHKAKEGKEVLFFSRGLTFPENINPAKYRL